MYGTDPTTQKSRRRLGLERITIDRADSAMAADQADTRALPKRAKQVYEARLALLADAKGSQQGAIAPGAAPAGSPEMARAAIFEGQGGRTGRPEPRKAWARFLARRVAGRQQFCKVVCKAA
jgi:hypothetical protein